MEQTSPAPRSPSGRNLSIAVAVVITTVLGEYFFRHYVLFWLPIVGDLRVNDMISLFLAYSLLMVIWGLIIRTNWHHELLELGHALRGLIMTWDYVPWLLFLILGLIVLPILDRLFWSSLTLPMLISSYRNSAVWFMSQAPPLRAAALILVNGLYVPVAEEYLWRGLAQVHLRRLFSPPLAIGITSLLFSLKHVLVDASFGRFLTLVAFGAICGIVAERKSWKSSAAIHLFVNTTTTIMGLVLGLE
jgi:membrane protease YdiL (CAAX protease family)